VLKQWQKPFVCAFGDSDPMTRGAARVLARLIPGCAGQAHATLQAAGHFIQEDAPEELARIVIALAARLEPVPGTGRQAQGSESSDRTPREAAVG
jgi:pimeloyl-ACP methyl ester carboxylesterase